MNSKAIKSDVIAVEADERDRDQVDAFLARNRDVLNAELRKSRAELSSDQHSQRSVSEIIAERRARLER